MFADDPDLPWSSIAVDVKANRVLLGFVTLDGDVAERVEQRYGHLPVCLDTVGEFRTVPLVPADTAS
jgi:hypothetical protein